MAKMKTEMQTTIESDPFRNGDGKFVSYGGSSIAMPLPAFVAKAMKASTGDLFWYRVAPDDRSVTIYLDDPDGDLVDV